MKRKRRDPMYDREGKHIGMTLITYAVLGVIVVLITWNPSGFSYLSMVRNALVGGDATFTYTTVMITLVLALFWFNMIRLTRRWYGWGLIVAGVIGVVAAFGFLQAIFEPGFSDGLTIFVWVALVALGIVLGIGMAGPDMHLYGRRIRS